MAALLRSGGSRLGIGPHGSASVGLVARSASLLQRRCYQGNLQDKDRIFTNVYGFQPWNLEAALKRGDWDNTKKLMELGQDVYSHDFEQPFLQCSADFYQVESNEYLAQNSAPDYMKKASAVAPSHPSLFTARPLHRCRPSSGCTRRTTA